MYLNALLNNLGVQAQYAWIFHGVIAFFAAFLVYWLARRILKRLQMYCEKTACVWDDTLVAALKLPLFYLVWLFAGVKFLEHILLFDLQEPGWESMLQRTHLILNVIIVIWFFWRYIGFIQRRLFALPIDDRKIDDTTISIIGRLAQIGLMVVGVLILLGTFGIPLSGLLAFGGGGAIIMGIAAQQLLSNFFGGLMIFVDKPFKLGDWIQSPDRNIEGIVTHIGWRTTKVMNFENRPIYVPNAIFNQVVIVNPGRMTHRRLNITVGIRYEDAQSLKDIVNAIEVMLRHHVHIDQKTAIMVHFMNFGPSSLDINIYCFTRTTSASGSRDVQQDVFFKIIEIVTAHQAQFAYPTVTTHIPQGIGLHQR